jgi:hypothetical protein
MDPAQSLMPPGFQFLCAVFKTGRISSALCLMVMLGFDMVGAHHHASQPEHPSMA